jgi:hypothetical protein
MNKLTILSVISESFNNYIHGSLDYDKFNNIINNIKYAEVSDDLVVLEETKLLTNILKMVTYYRVEDILNKYVKYLYQLDKDNNIVSFIDNYLSDILYNYSNRVEVILNIHINELARKYNYLGNIQKEETIECLKKISYEPEYLLGLYLLDKNNYHQESLLDSNNSLNIRDELSKVNYRKKVSIENNLKSTIVNLFDEDSYEEFSSKLLLILDEYKIDNPIDGEYLYNYVQNIIKKLFMYLISNMEKKKINNKNYEYTLQDMFK